MKKKLCIFMVLIVLCINISGHALVPSSPNSNIVCTTVTSGINDIHYNKEEYEFNLELKQCVRQRKDTLEYSEPSPRNAEKKTRPPQDTPPASKASKEVFLTFDDGPSPNTLKILKILNDNNVKATFFILGSNAERTPDIVRAEYSSGMTLLNHSYSHNYSMYKSVEGCMADFDKSRSVLRDITGVEPLNFIRFPGGSDNRVSNSNTMRTIRDTFAGKGMDYVDWNVSSEDATAAKVPADKIRNSTINQLSHKSFAVILMHDAAGKTTTVDALPAIIDYLKKQGFTFRTFKDLTSSEYADMVKGRVIDRNANK